jgi:hypothetical protein
MKHIVNITGKYLGIAGSKTILIDGQIEVPNAPPSNLIKPIWDFNNNIYYESATEEEILLNREIPNEVPLWALKIILNEMKIINNVINAFNLLEEPTKSRVNFVWEYGNSVERNSNTVNFIKSVLNLSDITLDTIFIEASKIKL